MTSSTKSRAPRKELAKRATGTQSRWLYERESSSSSLTRRTGGCYKWVTPEGRRELAAARIAEQAWLATLLNGLGDHELKATVHVVRVIRQRLERDARERDRHKRGRAR